MKTQLVFFLMILTPFFTFAAAGKGLSFSPGAEWVLNRDVQMQKAPSTPDDSGHYATVWNLRSRSFAKHGNEPMTKDSCLIKSVATPENLSSPDLTLKKNTRVRFVGMQESPSPSMIFDVSVEGAKKENLNQIQFVCTAYEKGLNTEKDRKEFRELMATSLGQVFTPKK